MQAHHAFVCPVCLKHSGKATTSFRLLRNLKQHAEASHRKEPSHINALHTWSCYSCKEQLIGNSLEGKITIGQLRAHFEDRHRDGRVQQGNNEAMEENHPHNYDDGDEGEHDSHRSEIVFDVRKIIDELAVDESELERVQLFEWISKHHISGSCYEDLINLKAFQRSDSYNSSLTRFKEQARKAVGNSFFSEAIFIMKESRKEVSCPILSIDAPVLWWLSHPHLLGQLRSHRDKYMNATIMRNLDAEIPIVEQEVLTRGLYNIGRTPAFLRCMFATRNMWWDNFCFADDHGIEVIPIHLKMFSDGWSWKSKVATKALWSWQLTCSQFNRATRSDASSVATVLLLVCLASIIKGNATLHKVKRYDGTLSDPPPCDDIDPSVNNQLIDLFKSDAESYARGKFVEVSGRKFLVIAVWHMMVTDGPGCKYMLEMSEANNSLLGGCRCCHVRKENFGDCLLNILLRCRRTNMEVKVLGTMCRKDSGLDLESLRRLYLTPSGLKGYSHLFDLPGMESLYQSPHELMHAIYANEVYRALKRTCMENFANKQQRHKFCKRLSDEFREYAKFNKLGCNTKFNDWKSLLNNLHSHGCKLFLFVAPFLLVKIAAKDAAYVLDADLMKYWILLRSIGHILSRHFLLPQDIRLAKVHTIELLHLLHFTYGDLRLNLHGLLHLAEDMIEIGLPRDCDAFTFEALHLILKAYLVHTNNFAEARVCFEKQLDASYMQLLKSNDREKKLYLLGDKHKVKQSIQFPEANFYDLDQHRLHHDRTWEVVTVTSNDTPASMVDYFAELDVEHFQFCGAIKGPGSRAVICYTEFSVGNYIMLKQTFTIGKIVNFLRCPSPRGEGDLYFISYYTPREYYDRGSVKHDYLEWTEFSLEDNIRHLYISPVEDIYSAPLSILCLDDSRCVLTSCEPLLWEE